MLSAALVEGSTVVVSGDGKALKIYLNDHLAGATSAMELLDDMEQRTGDDGVRRFVADLRGEISQDVTELEDIIERLGLERERVKEVLADLGESMSRLKLGRVGGPAAVSHLLELEMLSTGIWGKMRLWRSLDAAGVLASTGVDVDLDELLARAQRQLDAVEEQRLAAARRALG